MSEEGAGKQVTVGHYPEPVPISAYGNGGFRFASMSHQGGLLVLPDGVHGWSPTAAENVTVQDFAPVFALAEQIEFFIFGTGERQIFPSEEIRAAFNAHQMGLEVMDTGAALRTFNILLAENRRVAGAFIAVL